MRRVLLLLVATVAVPLPTRAETTPETPIEPTAELSVATSEDDACPRLSLLDDSCAAFGEVLGERVFEPMEVLAADAPEPGSPPARKRAAVSYRLNDSLSAGVSYRHSLLFGLAQGEALRTAPFTDFSTDRDRDILNLQLSWQLRWTFLDLGYRFDSPRAAPGSVHGLSLNRLWPEDGRRTHSLMLGIRREWGGAN